MFNPPRIVAPRCALLALFAALSLCACSGGTEPTEPAAIDEARFVTRWNEGIAAFDHYDFGRAAQIFDEIKTAHPELAAAWTNTGIARMNQATPQSLDQAEKDFARALSLDPEDLHAMHCRGVLAKYQGRFKPAERLFRRVLERDPLDATASYYLATILITLDRAEEAEALLRNAVRNEAHQASAIKNLSSLLRRSGRTAEGVELLELFQRFRESETGNLAGIVYSEMGPYGNAIRQAPIAYAGAPAPAMRVSWKATEEVADLPDGPRLTAALLDARQELSGDTLVAAARAFGPGLAMADIDRDGDLDAWVADPESAGRLWLNEDGHFRLAAPDIYPRDTGTASLSAVFGDVDNDGWIDLYVACAGTNRFYKNEAGKLVDHTAASGTAGPAVFTSQATMADLDADGDLDIYCANLRPLGASSAADAGVPNQLWNNNRDGTFTDIAARTQTDGGAHRSLAVLGADLDDDRDADLLVMGEGPLLVLRNDRIWRFASVAEELALGRIEGHAGALLEDLDGDGRDELLLIQIDGGEIDGRKRIPNGRFIPEPLPGVGRVDTMAAGDHDNDGQLDLLMLSAKGSNWYDGKARQSKPHQLQGLEPAAAIRSLLSVDVDGDGILDLVASASGHQAPIVHRGALDPERAGSGSAGWLAVDLVGVREDGKMRANTGGVGARLTLMTGSRAQTRALRSTTGVLGGAPPRVHFGLGSWTEADYVAVQWPDDLLQGEAKLSSGQVKRITQTYRKSSSCPLLFIEHEGRMEFVTDFLGTGGLGFFLSPGVYATPDPTERVRIPNFTAREGLVRLSIHEPMEEICYLDRARLLVVDHPIGTEVFPDERLATGEPAPTEQIFASQTDKRHWPTAIGTLDGPAPLELGRHSDRRYLPGVHPDPRFLGYAKDQALTFQFDAAIGSAKRPLVLHLDGWVEYPYSHVNFAAHQAGLREHSLSLDAEVKGGQWKTLLPEFGYPAGMPRVMTLPLPDLPEGFSGRLRLRTNLELYIDALWLAEIEAPESLTIHDLAPESATLRTTGYPREYSPDGAEPLLYDYALMDPDIDFKTMTGGYTRFGDVKALLTDAEDHYVIFGRAEEVRLEYRLPPLAAGHERTLILDTVGWCKDMDLYTAFPSTVAPHPFLGMPGYPYPPSQAPELRADFRAYQRTWNTRERRGAR